jgi:hypothetical protein
MPPRAKGAPAGRAFNTQQFDFSRRLKNHTPAGTIPVASASPRGHAGVVLSPRNGRARGAGGDDAARQHGQRVSDVSAALQQTKWRMRLYDAVNAVPPMVASPAAVIDGAPAAAAALTPAPGGDETIAILGRSAATPVPWQPPRAVAKTMVPRLKTDDIAVEAAEHPRLPIAARPRSAAIRSKTITLHGAAIEGLSVTPSPRRTHTRMPATHPTLQKLATVVEGQPHHGAIQQRIDLRHFAASTSPHRAKAVLGLSPRGLHTVLPLRHVVPHPGRLADGLSPVQNARKAESALRKTTTPRGPVFRVHTVPITLH